MISTSQGSIVPKGSLATTDVRPRIAALRRVPGAVTSLTADAIESLQQAHDKITKQLSSDLPALTKFEVADEKGALITWIGSRLINNLTYQGLWSKRLYVGGTDASNAPLFADNNGNVVIGKNGSLAIQNTLGTQKGFLGVKTEAALTITNATNNAGLVQLTTSVPHTYVTGDAVISTIPGFATGTGDFAITVVGPSDFTLNGSTFAGTYVSGGTVYRYYGGIWAQTAAFGGTGFSDANFRAFADGHVALTNALIDVTVTGGDEVVIDPHGTSGDIVVWSTGRTRPATFISAGLIRVQDVALNTTTINAFAIDTPQLKIGGTQVISTGRAITAATGITSSGTIKFSGIPGIAVLATDGTGVLVAATAATARTALGVYSSAQVDTLLLAKANTGTYTTSSALAGANAHTHTVTL